MLDLQAWPCDAVVLLDQVDTVAFALGMAVRDAITYREPGDCLTCQEREEFCPDHAGDIERQNVYLSAADRLGVPVPN
jgi:hypothetical protein